MATCICSDVPHERSGLVAAIRNLFTRLLATLSRDTVKPRTCVATTFHPMQSPCIARVVVRDAGGVRGGEANELEFRVCGTRDN